MSQNCSFRAPRVVELVQLARYTISDGERILYGQTIDGLLCVTDQPAAGPGHSYLVECGLDPRRRSALAALLTDYTRQAAELDQIPMLASVVRRTLAQEAACLRVPRPLL